MCIGAAAKSESLEARQLFSNTIFVNTFADSSDSVAGEPEGREAAGRTYERKDAFDRIRAAINASTAP
jgi:hypothetical protein